MVDLAEGTVVSDRYTVVRVLGRGGMAVVYEVMNAQLGTACALKVLAIASHSVQARLAREGYLQSQLAHPNIVAVFDVIEVGGSPGLLMELVRGPPLDELVSSTRLSFDQCDALAAGLLSGLGAAHERGLIHRDLKPANILCSVTGGQLIPKIADFGLAKIVSGDAPLGGNAATRSGTTMGTPSYMAPEQIRNAGRVDQRADLFSVGAILYEMVTGTKAFDGDDMLELFTAIAKGEFVRPRELRPDLPDRMERAILGALEPDREKRIRNVATLLQVWRGDRDDWTAEADGITTSAGSPWDPSLLARYAVTSVSGERPAGLSPLRPHSRAGTPRSDATLTAEAISALDEPEPTPRPTLARTPSKGSLSPEAHYAFAGGAFVALLALLGVAAGAVGLGMYWHLTSEPEVVVAPPEPAAPLQAASVPAPPPTPIAAVPAPGPVQEPVPAPEVVRPTPAPAPSPRPAAPKPRPAPSPTAPPEPAPAPSLPAPVPAEPAVRAGPSPGKARVDLAGDVARVWLQGPGGNVPLPAELDPGTYDIQAFFGGEPVMVGQVTLRAGAERTVRCDQALRKCK